jgi:hypothetical protein
MLDSLGFSIERTDYFVLELPEFLETYPYR